MAIDQLMEVMLKIPMDQTIVTYCNMHHLGQSRGEKAQLLLSEKGFKVQVIEGGFNEWGRLKLSTKSEK